ncbi:GIN domain-containing protein [Janthinobacterium sp.]|uniref:GIN domain-containing protein n=1 Tax=Janthinobacterium sp. TaxID=1871054 RepID=UPI00293D5AB2|nr:DUF2807 domain-containing protein [Janthinobacterium sp.]
MRTFLSIASLLALSGCVIVMPGGDGQSYSSYDSNGVQGNEQIAHELRPVGALSAIEVSGPIRLEVRVGGAPSLDIETDSNLLPLVHSDISGGTLKLWVDGGVRSRNGIRVSYSVAQLSELSASGSGRVIVSGLDGGALNLSSKGSGPLQLSGRVDQLALRMSGSGGVNAGELDAASVNASLHGSGRLTLGQLRGGALNADLYGSGSVRASGTVRDLAVQVHGSGSAQLDALSSETAKLASYGSGGIRVAVTHTLVAQSSGSGRISVRGNPAQRTLSGKNVSVVD